MARVCQMTRWPDQPNLLGNKTARLLSAAAAICVGNRHAAIWDRAKPGERKQIVEIAKTLVRGTRR